MTKPEQPMTSPSSKVALVTGAARGIGLATTKRFLADGWRVALLDIDGDNLTRTYAALAKPETTITITCDVADAAGVAKAIGTIAAKFGRLDALVNNAGIAIFKPILDVTYEDWSRVLAVNLTGPFLCTQAAAPLMRDSGGGAIVNTASVAGLVGFQGLGAYCGSKHGVIGLTKTAALEYAKAGIRVNCVCPGLIDTPMGGRLGGSDPAMVAGLVAAEPVGRLGRPSEIGEAAVWLCSDHASFVTGHSMVVDGGLVAQ